MEAFVQAVEGSAINDWVLSSACRATSCLEAQSDAESAVAVAD